MSRAEVATYVTVEDFQFYWRQKNDQISSLFNGLHMGHYKAAAYNDDLSLLHAAKLTLCARTGVPLDRWGFGVSVLLEKILGNNYVHKLQAICLFEADFHWWNKLIFAQFIMTVAREGGAMPACFF